MALQKQRQLRQQQQQATSAAAVVVLLAAAVLFAVAPAAVALEQQQQHHHQLVEQQQQPNHQHKPVELPEVLPRVKLTCLSHVASRALAATGCDGAAIVAQPNDTVLSLSPGGCINRRTLSRTWEATDACGHTSSRRQVIEVSDDEAPTLAGLPRPGQALALCAGSAVPRPTCRDACGCSVSGRQTGVVEFQGAARTATWAWTASDGCNDAAEASASYKFCACGAAAHAGPCGDEFPELEDAAAGLNGVGANGGRWVAVPAGGWAAVLKGERAAVRASLWAGAAGNVRAAGVNAGAVVLSRDGGELTVRLELHGGSEAPASDLRVAIACGAADVAVAPATPLRAVAPGVFRAALPAACTAAHVIVHNSAVKACPP